MEKKEITLSEEGKELYFYTKDHFSSELSSTAAEIASYPAEESKEMASTLAHIVNIRGLVKRSIDKYVIDYCTNSETPFSEEDFQQVSEKICQEVQNNDL